MKIIVVLLVCAAIAYVFGPQALPHAALTTYRVLDSGASVINGTVHYLQKANSK